MSQTHLSTNSQSAVTMGAPRDTRTSKSDEQLFGDYAQAVRQLGIAADAASEAQRLLRSAGADQKTAPAVDGESDDDPAWELLKRLTDQRKTAADLHRAVASHAIAEQSARQSGSTNDPIETT